jgi:hypothetical protein
MDPHHFGKPDPDPHDSEKPDQDPHQKQKPEAHNGGLTMKPGMGVQPGAVKAHNGAVKTHPGGPGGTALQGKSHLRIPFLGIARPQSQFPHSPHSCVCERFIYSQD